MGKPNELLDDLIAELAQGIRDTAGVYLRLDLRDAPIEGTELTNGGGEATRGDTR